MHVSEENYMLKKNVIIVVQSLSLVQLLVTPWTAARQDSLTFTTSLSLLKPMPIESMMSSNHLILCHHPHVIINQWYMLIVHIINQCTQCMGVLKEIRLWKIFALMCQWDYFFSVEWFLNYFGDWVAITWICSIHQQRQQVSLAFCGLLVSNGDKV